MMLIDCQTCPVRDVHCADCMVTALTAIPVGAPESETGLPLDRAERRAVSVLIAAGLVTHETANTARAVPTEGPTPLRLGRAAV
ncbi:hypothetical protein [Intrasporangium calvum]|uniref:Uncharacterized protein n=1 Tax=Intrasporangium calvum (strain ATCC 23552 / DSM 43043 / JCM 3097 / NBRC 12989 / NCIMB 10167 / NRRL B-3866 / 7 KIP) TaxID=710696 RepID=E6SBX9_INTC7|nr:hypothetical protein [Intrasporangium calvum]ADU48488.1 hypothetical protein Intca_1977 [Intrasporangium calvum DSM 43043]